mgnify:FL=1
MKQTEVFHLPSKHGAGDVVSVVLYSAMLNEPIVYRKPKVLGRFVVFDCVSSDAIRPSFTGVVNPYELEKASPDICNPKGIELYQYFACFGLLDVKYGHPIVARLFQRISGDVPYHRWQWVPGIFLQITYADYYSAVLGLIPAVKDSCSNPIFVHYPWCKTESD